MIPAVPMGGHFKYLGKIYDFQALNEVPKKEFLTKLEKILVKISSLKVRCQTKLKIFSRYVPSQFNFELKIYNFTDAFLSGTIDRLCTKHLREWLEFSPSSCVTEWASSPITFCGLGIPTFAQRAARLKLTRRHLLRSSKNASIRELWEVTNHPNILADSLLDSRDLKGASSILRASQNKESLEHFLGLKSQGAMAKTVNETVLPANIKLWKLVMDSSPEHVFNLARKAMMNQLPTLHNLKLWNRSSTNLCTRCGGDQTNKHVLSNCSSPDALAQYTDRHNLILEIIVKWIVPQLKSDHTLYSDLRVPGARPVCDIFNGYRPDLAIVSSTKIVVGELIVCHETNLQRSRDYKLQKYSQLAAAKASEFKRHEVLVHTIEVSTLGFVVVDPNFCKSVGLSSFDPPLLKDVVRSAISSSRSIFCNRGVIN